MFYSPYIIKLFQRTLFTSLNQRQTELLFSPKALIEFLLEYLAHNSIRIFLYTSLYSLICRFFLTLYISIFQTEAVHAFWTGQQVCNFIKKKLQHRRFPLNIAKILITAFFTEPL